MFDFQPKLTGELIEMRPLTEADFEALYALASDPLIWEIHPSPNRWQRPVFREYIDSAFADRGGLLAIDRATGEIAGFSRYSQSYVRKDEVEIGWTFLSRTYWGGAHNRDMKRIMLVHALGSFERVIFRIGAGNLRSRRAVEKIGGELSNWSANIEIDGRQVPYVAYQITREGFATGPLSVTPA